jgi:hypothetical protein
VKAVESRNWAEAKRLMRSAIGERSEERKRYTPYYYLGLALFELGDCDGALGSWQESERQGALGRDELEKIRDGRAVCRSRSDDRTRVAAELAAVEAMEQAARSAAGLRSALGPGIDDLWQRGDPSPSDREKDASARLEAARVLIEKARAERDAGALGRGESEAREIAKVLDQLRAEALRLRSEQRARLGNQRAKIDDLVGAARELLRSTSDLAPYPPQVRRKRADLESLLAEVDNLADGATDAYLAGLISRLTFSVQQAEEVTARPPAALSKAADSFFAGDYAGVLDALATPTGDSARVRAHSLLLRSAAGYYLWVQGGESDQDLLAAAAADAALCQRIDAELRPPSALFSPRFVEFFATAVGSPEPPPTR